MIDKLLYRNPQNQACSWYWQLLDILSNGGYKVTDGIKRELLANPTSRPANVIEKRVKVAAFEPITGSVINKLVSQLLRDKANYFGSDDDFWNDFFSSCYKPDCTSFHRFLTDATFKALTQGCAIALIDTKSDEQEPYVLLLDRWQLWDYAKDGDNLKYAKIHQYFETRDYWYQEIDRYHEFLIYQKVEDKLSEKVFANKYRVRIKNDDGLKSFGVADLDNFKESDLSLEIVFEDIEVFYLEGQESKIPIVHLQFPNPLWIADQLFDLQKSHFNASASGEWALAATNYAQLIFTGVDRSGEEFNDNPARWSPSGDGYFWELKPGMDVKWLERQTEGISLAFQREKEIKEAMLEKIYTISQSLVSYRQSGESKKEDRRSLDILLEVYGSQIAEFAGKVLNVASIAHGEDVNWIVEGFSDYDSETLSQSLDEYLLLEKANIPSKSLKIETQKGIASRAIKELGLSQEKTTEIIREIEANTPYHLDKDEMALIERLFSTGALSEDEIRSILAKAGILNQ